jgi:DNA-binding XRE family transcriptional regulator
MTLSSILSKIETKDREIARLQQRKNELQKQFGKLACTVRMRRNIKQNALAKAVGSSSPTICNMETGFFAASTELCRKIAEQLKKP